jgi:hypothetical protein
VARGTRAMSQARQIVRLDSHTRRCCGQRRTRERAQRVVRGLAAELRRIFRTSLFRSATGSTTRISGRYARTPVERFINVGRQVSDRRILKAGLSETSAPEALTQTSAQPSRRKGVTAEIEATVALPLVMSESTFSLFVSSWRARPRIDLRPAFVSPPWQR